MQNLGFVGVLASLALAGVAQAGEPAPSGPAPNPVAWRCEGGGCGGSAAGAPSDAQLRRECERVVSVIGPLSRYQSRGRELSAHDLAQCNRRATRLPLE